MSSQGINEIIINLHHKPQAISSYFSDGRSLGLKIKYSFEPKILGTAGAVKKVEADLNEPFLVVYGDNFCNFNYRELIDFHASKSGLGTIALTQGVNPLSGGIAKIHENDQILKFLEKPKGHEVFSEWINAGIYLLEPTVCEDIPKDKYFDFGHDLFPKLISSGRKIFGHKISKPLRGVNTPEEYSEAQKLYSYESNLDN